MTAADDLTARVRAQLDQDTYRALARAILAREKDADRAGYARGLTERAPPSQIAAALRGLTRSWTAGAGALLIALPEILPLLQADLPGLLGPRAADTVMRAAGVLMILLRIKTTNSVWAKGVAAPMSAGGGK